MINKSRAMSFISCGPLSKLYVHNFTKFVWRQKKSVWNYGCLCIETEVPQTSQNMYKVHNLVLEFIV